MNLVLRQREPQYNNDGSENLNREPINLNELDPSLRVAAMLSDPNLCYRRYSEIYQVLRNAFNGEDLPIQRGISGIRELLRNYHQTQ